MKPREPIPVVRYDDHGNPTYPRQNAKNQALAECEHCGAFLGAGDGRVWWCTPANGQCNDPAHWMAGGPHVTCLDASNCVRRALEWSGLVTCDDVWRVLERLGRAPCTLPVVVDTFDGERIIELDVAMLSEAQFELFEERAAIMEYDGGLERSIAEREAYLGVVA